MAVESARRIAPVAAPARSVGRPAPGWLVPTLVVLLFLSGTSALIYQVLWLRLLGLVFGVTIWAASTVLASFMAGLAIGSLVAGRLVDRSRRPLLWFGLGELLIGLSGLATPSVLALAERAYVALHPWLPDGLGPLSATRAMLSFAVLITPATLMGATLPIVVKSSLPRAGGFGQRVGLLYATNTAGAVIGTLLAGFVLIGGVGMEASFRLAAAVNGLVGLVALAGAMRLGPIGLGPARRPASAPAAEIDGPARNLGETARRVVLVAFALSGFCSLALEVIWFRALALYVPVTTYAFTVMLASVLVGIAAGSCAVAGLMRRRTDWLAVLAGLELAVAVSTVLSLLGLSLTYDVLGAAGALLGRRPPELAAVGVASLLAIVPTALLLGVAFPIGLRSGSRAPTRRRRAPAHGSASSTP
jgi:spermidine synthase